MTKPPQTVLHVATDAEIAWAAGLFEGEGTITAYKTKGRWFNVGLAVSSTDHDVLVRLLAILGVGDISDAPVNKNKPAPHYKDAWRWRVHDIEGFRYALNLMLPWLCKRRTARALEVLEMAKDRQPRGKTIRTECLRGGHAMTEDNILWMRGRGGKPSRRCKKCRQLSKNRRNTILRDQYAARKIDG